MASKTPKDDETGDEPVVNDKRKIDPDTGEVREPAAESSDEDIVDAEIVDDEEPKK